MSYQSTLRVNQPKPAQSMPSNNTHNDLMKPVDGDKRELVCFPHVLIPGPVSFQNQDILSAATQWTKTRIFEQRRVSSNTSPSSTPAKSPSDHHPVSCHPVAGPDLTGTTRISFNQDGRYALVAYPSLGVIQVWQFHDDVSKLSFVGSLSCSEGKILKADVLVLDEEIQVLVQLSRKRGTYLELYAPISGTKMDIVLPPSSSGPGPYHVYCPSNSDYFAIATSNGLVTVFSQESHEVVPICGIEAGLGADNRPLVDVQSRWLAFSPKTLMKEGSSAAVSDGDVNASIPRNHTPVKLPPRGPLYERIVESLSATAAASLKSLSDAGKAGIKHYLSKGQVHKPSNGSTTTVSPKSRHEMYGYFSDNYYYYDNDEDPASPTSPSNGTDTNPSSLRAFSHLFFGDPATMKAVQVVDIPTRTTIGYFVPLHGISALSLSPYDAAVSAVSTKGDSIDTYDISSLPNEVTLSGRYIRGRLPAKTQQILWDNMGGLGMTTWDKGSLHWFDKRRSYYSNNKIWKYSAWGIDQAACVNWSESAHPLLLLSRQGQILVTEAHSGKCISKFDMPLVPVEGDKGGEDALNTNGSQHYHLDKSSDPLAHYELETCLPFPYIHTDRRITLSVISSDRLKEYFVYEDKHDFYNLRMFGQAIQGNVVDFGRSNGQVDVQSEEEGDLIDAMAEIDDLEEKFENDALIDELEPVNGTHGTAGEGEVHGVSDNNQTELHDEGHGPDKAVAIEISNEQEYLDVHQP